MTDKQFRKNIGLILISGPDGTRELDLWKKTRLKLNREGALALAAWLTTEPSQTTELAPENSPLVRYFDATSGKVCPQRRRARADAVTRLRK